MTGEFAFRDATSSARRTRQSWQDASTEYTRVPPIFHTVRGPRPARRIDGGSAYPLRRPPLTSRHAGDRRSDESLTGDPPYSTRSFRFLARDSRRDGANVKSEITMPTTRFGLLLVACAIVACGG